ILFEFMFDHTGHTSVSNYEIGKAIRYAKKIILEDY
ncbi:unnamed protein product, partial [marine sediment metagenome]